MQNILVTGASGFLGSHIVLALRARGYIVRSLVRPSSRLHFLRESGSEFAWGDVTAPATLVSALEGVDAVVHCAGLTKACSRREYFKVNAEGTQNLLAACRAHRDRLMKIVHVSSLAALGPAIDEHPITENTVPHPVSDYGTSKLLGQQAAENCMEVLPVSIIIPPAVYGPRDVDLLVYFKFAARGFIPLIGRRPRFLSLIYGEDLAEAVVRILLSERTAGKSYLVDDGCVYTWTDIAEELGVALARRPRHVHVPVSIAELFGALGTLTGRLTGRPTLINSQKLRDLLQRSWVCSSRRLREELEFCPRYTLPAGMRKTLAWYRQCGWL